VTDTPPTGPFAVRGGMRRVAWHALGVIVAGLVAWLILLGYRQPELLLELANMRLC
jgi:hypothetical protein